MENLFELYFEQLHTTKTPGKVLAEFYCSLFNLAFSPQKIITFNKLLKLYSRDVIFFAISDCADIDNLDHENIHRLLSYFCKKRMESRYKLNGSIVIDLTETIKELNKKIDKLSERKVKFNDPFDE